MKLYEVKVNVYADDERQAQAAEEALNSFVTELRAKGRAVTAQKLAEAVGKWQRNAIVRVEVLNHFPKIAK